MKKFLLVLLAFSGALFAADAQPVINEMLKSYSTLAAGVGLGVAACGGAIGIGSTAAATIAGTARNPSLSGKLTTTMFVAIALIEAQVIYALVIGLFLLYANPLLG